MLAQDGPRMTVVFQRALPGLSQREVTDRVTDRVVRQSPVRAPMRRSAFFAPRSGAS